MSPRKVALLGWGLYGGCGLSVLSFVALLAVTGSNVFQVLRNGHASNGLAFPICVLLIVTGLASSIASLAVGLLSHSRRFRGPQQQLDWARIVGRYALTRDQVMLTNDWEFEGAERLRYYVRMQISANEVYDYECEQVTFFQAGEGMVGRADVQGRWLGRFVPFVGTPD